MQPDSTLVTTTDEGYKGHEGGPNGTVTRVVIHGTVSATTNQGAENTAHYFESANAGGLAHYIVDPDSIVQTCPESLWCWHAPPNPGSIGIELDDPQNHDAPRWNDIDHKAMQYLAACLTADICRRLTLPIVKLSATDLLAGKRGICGHADVVAAWHESDHSDPGSDYPWPQFIGLVQAAHDHYSQGDDMPLTDADVKKIGDAIVARIMDDKTHPNTLVNLAARLDKLEAAQAKK